MYIYNKFLVTPIFGVIICVWSSRAGRCEQSIWAEQDWSRKRSGVGRKLNEREQRGELVAEREAGVTEIGLSGSGKFCHSRSAHMLWLWSYVNMLTGDTKMVLTSLTHSSITNNSLIDDTAQPWRLTDWLTDWLWHCSNAVMSSQTNCVLQSHLYHSLCHRNIV